MLKAAGARFRSLPTQAARQADAVNREAAQFYEALGQQVAALGGSVFLGCLGHAQLGSRILACLMQPCGGRILSYPDPSDQVAADLLWFVHAGKRRCGVYDTICAAAVGLMRGG